MTLTPVQKLCEREDVVIANGASLSAALNLNGRVACGVYMPAAWTAAGMTFASCDTIDGTYLPVNVFETGLEYVGVVAASGYYRFDPMVFYGVNFLKVRSGAVAAAVNQGAARTLTLMCAVPARAQ